MDTTSLAAIAAGIGAAAAAGGWLARRPRARHMAGAGGPPWELTPPADRYLVEYPDAKAPQSVHEVRLLVQELTHASREDYIRPWISLAWIGAAAVPYYEEAYLNTERAEGRVRLVFNSRAFAKTEAAFRLGVAALDDKGLLVRYRACQLLAESERRDAIPKLRRLLTHADARTREDAAAAINAIERKQPALFLTWPRTARAPHR